MTWWATSDEKSFLNNIGEHQPKRRRALRAQEKISCLQNYLNSMDVRSQWGAIDREEVKRYATQLLESYEALTTRKEENA